MGLMTPPSFVALRIEWCKSRARALRWSEEVELLQEEMTRVLRFFSWQADWWEEQTTRLSGLDLQQQEGIKAYAMRQAHIRRTMHANCVRLWADTEALLATWRRFDSGHPVGTGITESIAPSDVFT